MKRRWVTSTDGLPMVDKKDIMREVPLVNGGKLLNIDDRLQHNAEFSQPCFKHMRQLERKHATCNYFNPTTSTALQQHLQKGCKINSELFVSFRNIAVHKILELHELANFDHETIFRAVGIFDRYLAKTGHWKVPRENYNSLAIVCLCIGAKVEQRCDISFHEML